MFKFPFFKIQRSIGARCKDSLEARGLKLAEECGEVAAEIGKLTGSKPMKEDETEYDVKRHLHLELCDVIIVAMDMLIRLKETDAYTTRVIRGQLVKWDEYLKKQELKQLNKELKLKGLGGKF